MRIEAIGERIVQEPVGGAEDPEIVRVFKPQALKRAEIVHIAQFVPQLVHDFPITRAGAIAVGGLQPFSKVLPNSVVVEERIVDVEQKDGVDRCIHSDVPVGDDLVASPPSCLDNRARSGPGQAELVQFQCGGQAALRWEASACDRSDGETRSDDMRPWIEIRSFDRRPRRRNAGTDDGRRGHDPSRSPVTAPSRGNDAQRIGLSRPPILRRRRQARSRDRRSVRP